MCETDKFGGLKMPRSKAREFVRLIDFAPFIDQSSAFCFALELELFCSGISGSIAFLLSEETSSHWLLKP
jgi:hypothetical protein